MKGHSFPTGRRCKEAWAWTQAGLAQWRRPPASPLTNDQDQEEGVSWHQMSAARADPTSRSRPSLHLLLKYSLGLPGRSCFSRGQITWDACSLDQGKVHAGDSSGQQCLLPACPRASPCRWIWSSVSTLHGLDCRVMSLNSKAELWESRNEILDF